MLQEKARLIYEEEPNKVYTEDLIKEIAPDYIGRDPDNIEVLVMASTIWDLQNENNEEAILQTETNTQDSN